MTKSWNLKALAMGIFICLIMSVMATYAFAIVASIFYSLVQGGSDAAAATLLDSPVFYGTILVMDVAFYLAGGITIARMTKGAEVRHAAVISAACLMFGLVLIYFFPPQNSVQNITNYISCFLTLTPIGAAHWKSKQL